MFSYQQIQRYNETDTCIYRYITANMDKVPYMTIRELARELHVSAATILRFCNKHDFQGYGQFKDALKMELEARAASRPREDLRELAAFFQGANSLAFEEKLEFAVEAVRRADLTIFVGAGAVRPGGAGKEDMRRKGNGTCCPLLWNRFSYMIVVHSTEQDVSHDRIREMHGRRILRLSRSGFSGIQGPCQGPAEGIPSAGL
ncbi:MAG: MurR/RpiR family transcriptional regulator [Lachnospiraceae bacterium]|nr:MurR/RpiR family transcriptional regulator [Lachnospiraceae bacterium]